MESSSDDEALEYDEELYLAFADESSESSNDDDDNENNNETNDIDNDNDDNDINDNNDEDAFAILCNFIGGIPFWLRSDALPSEAQIECEQCHVPLVQLMQLYAPLDDRTDLAFHRVIHVLACAACGDRFQVLRSQLPKVNAFYAEETMHVTKVVEAAQIAARKEPLCWCGLPARKRCARCTTQAYCSKQHQKADWPNHRASCVAPSDASPAAAPAPASPAAAAPRVTLPRLHFVTEPEPTSSERLEARREKDAAAMKNAKLVTSEEAESFPDDELDEAVSEQTQGRDVLYARFQRRVAAASEQLVRYWHWDGTGDVCERGDEQVLWATSSTAQTSSRQVPPCEHCGAKRSFEFQLMPQLLYFVTKQSKACATIDFATLVVYTCSASCAATSAYINEHTFTQKFS